MGFLDRLFGTEHGQAQAVAPRRAPRSDDELAIERYRYLLRTAPPETLEQVHAEAFAKLSDEQRALIYEELSQGAATGERPLSSEPATLARAATRAELRNPGTLERSFQGGVPGFGSMVASSLLGTVAGYVIGSALVSAFLPWDAGSDANADGGDNSGDAGADASAASADAGGSDFGGSDFGVSDFGDFSF